MLGELEVAVDTQPLQAVHALAGIGDARLDELVGRLALEFAGEQLGVLRQHALAHGFQRLAPGPFTAGIGEALVNPGLAGLLVFQQQIGHAAVGRNDEDPLVQLVALSRADKDVVQDFFEAAHGRAADLFYGMHGCVQS